MSWLRPYRDTVEQSQMWIRLAKCALAYFFIFIATYPLLIFLKASFTVGLGNRTRDIAGLIISPIALFALGFVFGRWLGLIGHLACMLGACQAAVPETQRVVEFLGERGASYVWPKYLAGAYLFGWIVSSLIIARGYARSKERQELCPPS